MRTRGRLVKELRLPVNQTRLLNYKYSLQEFFRGCPLGVQ